MDMKVKTISVRIDEDMWIELKAIISVLRSMGISIDISKFVRYAIASEMRSTRRKLTLSQRVN